MSLEPRKRSRFDQTEPEPPRKTRFDRRSRSPARSPGHDSSKKEDTTDPAAKAAAAAARINEQLKAKREQGGSAGTPIRKVRVIHVH